MSKVKWDECNKCSELNPVAKMNYGVCHLCYALWSKMIIPPHIKWSAVEIKWVKQDEYS